MQQQEMKLYTPEEIKKIAPGYRGKPEKFDLTKVGKKREATPKTQGPATPKVPAPTATDKAAKPAPPKNSLMWSDSIFGIDVAVERAERQSGSDANIRAASRDCRGSLLRHRRRRPKSQQANDKRHAK